MELIQGDCLTVLRNIDSNSIDSLVTDPPAGISFMGKAWDGDKGGSKQWIAWMQSIAVECLRALKPGAHGLVWALPRTSHRTATALENAGFEIRDVVTHIFGSGFPKSQNISKTIDKAAGAEREVLGESAYANKGRTTTHNSMSGAGTSSLNEFITAPATDEAKQWEGWGTALKPASEHWVLIRKPLSEKTVAKNVLKHGTGGLNIDASRISTSQSDLEGMLRTKGTNIKGQAFGIAGRDANWTPEYTPPPPNNAGRFPANLILSHHPDCEPECHDECAVAELDRQSIEGGMHSAGKPRKGGQAKQTNDGSLFGVGNHEGNGARIGDTGGASRFFMSFSSLCGSEKTAEGATCAGKKAENKNESLSTAGFGNRKTDLFLMSTISITKMETSSIITFQILNASTKTIIGTCTVVSESVIESSMASLIESVRLVSNTEALIYLLNEQQEPIKGIASIVLEQSLPPGEKKTENTTTNICVNIESGKRFFYCAKASKRDKNEGLEGMPEKDVRPLGISNWDGQTNGSGKTMGPSKSQANHHPTVKNTKLMEYLICMITPEGGMVLDPFMGSGSTGVAAVRCGFDFLGIEQSQEYFEIASARIKNSERIL